MGGEWRLGLAIRGILIKTCNEPRATWLRGPWRWKSAEDILTRYTVAEGSCGRGFNLLSLPRVHIDLKGWEGGNFTFTSEQERGERWGGAPHLLIPRKAPGGTVIRVLLAGHSDRPQSGYPRPSSPSCNTLSFRQIPYCVVYIRLVSAKEDPALGDLEKWTWGRVFPLIQPIAQLCPYSWIYSYSTESSFSKH